MKLTLEQAPLQKALSRIGGVIERSQTIPILGHVLIEADGEIVTLSGSNLDMHTVVHLPARVERPGAITVPAGTMSDIARNAPNGAELLLDYEPVSDPRLTVRFGRSSYQLAVLPAHDFPARDDPAWPTSLDLDARDLRAILGRSSFAASTDETRYFLNGTYLHVVAEANSSWLRAAAADTTRLAYAQVRAPSGLPVFPGAILPRKTVSEFMKLLDNRVGPVVLQLSRSAVRLSAGEVAISSKLVDGEYPDYTRPIAPSYAIETSFDRLALAGAVRRVALISGEKERGVKLTLDDGAISVSVRNMEAGQAAEEIEIPYRGPRLELGFNARIILEALDQSEADRLLLRANGPRDPITIVPELDDAEAGLMLSVLSPRIVHG
ncbi:DNA polymerase III subunit beta [compost metagenome]